MSYTNRLGVDIFYERAGDGPAVVFAHGAGGNGAVWWQQTPYFAERFTCITFDHRYFGLSRCSVEDFRPSEFGADLVAILDAEGIDRAHLVCQSMGGWTGLQVTLNHPERVNSLCLCDTFGGINDEEAILSVMSLAERQAGRDMSELALGAPFIEKFKSYKYLYDQINRFNAPLEQSAAALLLGPDVLIDPKRLKGITCPVMLIAGSVDEIFPCAMLKKLSGLFPDAAFKEFEGLGHSVYFEDPDAFNRTVEAFIAGV